MSILNPIYNIRKTCSRVEKDSVYVSIDSDAIDSFVDELIKKGLVESGKTLEGVEWDACGWHYNADASIFGEKTCQYIFVLDSLNFCFWEVEGLEYETLAITLRDKMLFDSNSFDASRLASITADEITQWFPSDKQLPNMIERVRVLRELGHVLIEEFHGLASNLVAKANGSAVKLVELVIRYLPGFRDCGIYKGYRVDFYKRAQILAGDVWAAYGRQIRSNPNRNTIENHSTENIYAFYDIDQLTMFADYRVPQILRHYHILRYESSLEQRIDSYMEITSGSEEESEIRAMTILAVDRIQQALGRKGIELHVIEVDWLLWQYGETVKDEIRPHHRTKTIFY